MLKDEFIYTSLCSLFSVLLVVGNLTYQKFVYLPLLFFTFELSVGAILYPLTFLLTDLITEFYGKERASFCVKMGIFLGIFMNILVACIIISMDHLEATTWSKVDNIMFSQMFGLYSVAFVGSILACYTAQSVDIVLYLWIRKITKGKWLWARNTGSSAISLFIDTFIVITFMRTFNVIPTVCMWSLIINSYLFKLFFSFCSTPLFYGSVWIIRGLQKDKRAYHSLAP